MPSAPFRVESFWPSRGVGLVEVAGEVDMHTAQELGEVLAAAVASRPRRLIADLSAVGFIDSIGLSALVRSARSLQADGGSFEIVCAVKSLLEVFEIAGLTDVLTFHETREEALGR